MSTSSYNGGLLW